MRRGKKLLGEEQRESKVWYPLQSLHAQECAANAVEKSILRLQDLDGFDHI